MIPLVRCFVHPHQLQLLEHANRFQAKARTQADGRPGMTITNFNIVAVNDDAALFSPRTFAVSTGAATAVFRIGLTAQAPVAGWHSLVFTQRAKTLCAEVNVTPG